MVVVSMSMARRDVKGGVSWVAGTALSRLLAAWPSLADPRAAAGPVEFVGFFASGCEGGSECVA